MHFPFQRQVTRSHQRSQGWLGTHAFQVLLDTILTCKNSLLLPALLIANAVAAQADTASGYLLRIQGDTLYQKILVCEGFRANQPGACFTRGMVALDADSARIYDAEELLGFGFRWRNKILHYRALKTERSKAAFFSPVAILGRLTLFEQNHDATVPGGFVLPAYGSPNTPLRAVTVRNFYLRDRKGNTLKLPDVGKDELRRRIKKFLKDEPDLLPLVDEYVTGIFSIPVFVREANKK